jgi:AraC-like DNA-binding protein
MVKGKLKKMAAEGKYAGKFSSQTHFSTAFRKFYGISPTEFMNRETEQ